MNRSKARVSILSRLGFALLVCLVLGACASPPPADDADNLTLGQIQSQITKGMGAAEVAQALGQANTGRARQMTSLALYLSLLLGALLVLFASPAAAAVASALGATDEVHAAAVRYMHIRLLGAPAVLTVMAALGALRA